MHNISEPKHYQENSRQSTSPPLMHVIDLIDHFSQLNHSRNSQITMHAGQCRISSKRDWQIHLDVQKSSKNNLAVEKVVEGAAEITTNVKKTSAKKLWSGK